MTLTPEQIERYHRTRAGMKLIAQETLALTLNRAGFWNSQMAADSITAAADAYEAEIERLSLHETFAGYR